MTSKTSRLMVSSSPVPDLSPAAVKVARRIQALKNNRTYVIIVTKTTGQILLTVEEKGKAEHCHA